MKVAVVGIFGNGQLATALARGMRGATQDVVEISDAHEMPGNKLARFAAERWAVASSALAIAGGGQEGLVRNVVEARPDLVLIVKSPYLTRNTVVEIRNQTRALVVNWLPDDPFLALRPAMKLATLAAYDLVVTYSDAICLRLTSELGLSAMVIPFGFDPSDYRPAMARSVEWDVTFVGQWSKYRERILSEIARTGLALRVYGPNWHHAQSKVRDCWNSTEVYGADACTTYQQGHVGINILHPRNNAGSHNMRTFEVPAAGCKMLTTETAQQRHLLEGIGGIDFYSAETDLAQRLKSLVASAQLPDESAMSEHTYKHRCVQLLTMVGR